MTASDPGGRPAPGSISCVIPTHARPQLLESTLRSVLAQTRRPDEIVVVSDVADPEAARVCAALDAGIVYREPDIGRGASASRNAGARISSGEWIAFLDDDDLWSEDCLVTAEQAHADAGGDLVLTWLTIFSTSGEWPGPHVAPGLGERAVGAMNPGVTGSNIVVRRSAFERIGGFDELLPVKNDTDFLFRYLRAGLSYAVNSRGRVLQRKHVAGQLTDRGAARLAGLRLYLHKHRAALTAGGRRRLRLEIHRMERDLAAAPLPRAAASVGILANYGLSEAVRRASGRTAAHPSYTA